MIAHDQMVKGRKDLLIVILKEKINEEKLPPNLRVYIRKFVGLLFLIQGTNTLLHTGSAHAHTRCAHVQSHFNSYQTFHFSKKNLSTETLLMATSRSEETIQIYYPTIFTFFTDSQLL